MGDPAHVIGGIRKRVGVWVGRGHAVVPRPIGIGRVDRDQTGPSIGSQLGLGPGVAHPSQHGGRQVRPPLYRWSGQPAHVSFVDIDCQRWQLPDPRHFPHYAGCRLRDDCRSRILMGQGMYSPQFRYHFRRHEDQIADGRLVWRLPDQPSVLGPLETLLGVGISSGFADSCVTDLGISYQSLLGDTHVAAG